jgi:predicted SPOUT superfamily RNA methylase MTH1
MNEANYVPSWKREQPAASAVESTEENSAATAALTDEATTPESGSSGEVEDTAKANDGTSTEAPVEVSDESNQDVPIEQLDDYNDKTYEGYAKRFGKTLQDVQDDPSLKAIIKQKIDSDVFIKQLQEKIAKAEASATPEKPDDKLKETVTKTDPKAVEAEFEQQLEAMADAITDPAMADKFGRELIKAWGFDPASTDETTQALVKNLPAMAKVYTKFGTNLVATLLPQMLEQAMEMRYPGFATAWESTDTHRQYEIVRQGTPEFAKLPAYGSPDFDAMMAKVREIEPELDQTIYKDKSGNPLPKQQQLQRRYRFAMKIALSQQATPAVVSKAVETGKNIQKAADKNLQVAKAVAGSGQSKGKFQPENKNIGSGLGIVEAWKKRELNL